MSKLTQKFVENQKVIVAFDADTNRKGGMLPLFVEIGERGTILEYDDGDDAYKVMFENAKLSIVPIRYSGPQWIGAECLVSA